jgi:hypothetical protein
VQRFWSPPQHRYAQPDPTACPRCRRLEFCPKACIVERDGDAIMLRDGGGTWWRSVDRGESWRQCEAPAPPPLSTWDTGPWPRIPRQPRPRR